MMNTRIPDNTTAAAHGLYLALAVTLTVATLIMSAPVAAKPPLSVEITAQRVVRVKGVGDGFGLIVGESDTDIYIITANHVLRQEPDGTLADDIAVRFRPDVLDSRRWHDAEALTQFHAQSDFAVIRAKKPAGLRLPAGCAVTALDDYRVDVWFVGRDGTWDTSGLPGVIRDRQPDTDSKLGVDMSGVRPGSSGAPLISEAGPLGLILTNNGLSEAVAVALRPIRNLFERDWLPWDLPACVSAGAEGAGGIAGRWSSPFGPFTFAQKGQHITGRLDYYFPPGTYATIDGTQEDQDFKLVWWVFLDTKANPTGSAALHLSKDGRTLTGHFTDKNTGEITSVVLNRDSN